MESKILIVDSDSAMRRLIQLALEEKGRTFFFAGDGEEALDVAFRHTPHLIILDLLVRHSPNGWEVARQIREDPRTKACKVLLMSVSVRQAWASPSLEEKADTVIQKPFSITDLQQKVARLLFSPFGVPL